MPSRSSLNLVYMWVFAYSAAGDKAGRARQTLWCTFYSQQVSQECSVLTQMDKQGHLVKTLKAAGSQSILASAWSPQGTPLVSCDKAGAVTFWAQAESGSAMQQAAESQFVTSPKRQTG